MKAVSYMKSRCISVFITRFLLTIANKKKRYVLER
jgi:hypothetical protein